jgi:ribosome-binding factor A
MSRRTSRVAQLYREELARLMARENTLEGLLLTITSIEITPDLKQAFIYLSSLNKQKPLEESIAIVQEHARDWQHAIGKRVRLKNLPRLSFRPDTSLERGDRVLHILSQIDPAPPAPKSPRPLP